MELPISPLAPTQTTPVLDIKGLRVGTGNSGTKYRGRDDVTIIQFPAGTIMAGVYTKNKCPGAPIEWNRALTPGPIDTLVVNAGNANVFTGAAGHQSVAAMAEAAPGNRVTVSSTGVIGEPLDDAAMIASIKAIGSNLDATLSDAAQAIRTTDTFAKSHSLTFEVASGQSVTITGIAKGSGMVAPDLATMLAYVFTDAALSPQQAQTRLTAACDPTFNAISVDSDQSTSDTVQLFATGAVPLAEERDHQAFDTALVAVCQQLAELVVRDGEGASKLARIHVLEAEHDQDAKRIALSIANSPLVKTALAGNDANWGRIVMAVGKAGAMANRDKLWIKFGDLVVAQKGQRHPDYDEAAATAIVSEQSVDISVGVGVGSGRASVLTCDLTHRYISINGDYRS